MANRFTANRFMATTAPEGARAFSKECCPMRSDHALFKTYPLDGQVTVGGESLTTPYHVYDGSMLFLGGTADAGAAAHLLANEGLTPLLDADGRALAAVWACDFTEANLGPHLELQISLFASVRPMPPLEPHPFRIFRALTAMPETRMVCHGLWNSTPRVVRYNAEHLGLNARLASGGFERSGGRVRFGFRDDAGGMIVDGDLGGAARQSPVVLWRILRHIGVRGLLRSARSPFIHVPVVNTRGPFAGENLVAHTYTRSDKQTIRPFDPQDRLRIGHPQYAPLNFAPDFVQQVDGVRFVYLRPQAERR